MEIFIKNVENNDELQTTNMEVIDVKYPNLLFKYKDIKFLDTEDGLEVKYEYEVVANDTSKPVGLTEEDEQDFAELHAKKILDEIVSSTLSKL